MRFDIYSRRALAVGVLIVALAVVTAIAITMQNNDTNEGPKISPNETSTTTTTATTNPFYYNFDTKEMLYEAGSIGGSSSPYWWVDSGAELILNNGVGSTVIGSLPENDPWRILYAKNNPVDTDDGYHPQNIFRLITRGQWANDTEEAYFKIDASNLSMSPNRNESNGLLLFNRYQDHNDLYYAGVRVDGYAVIKKKTGGTYYTLAYNKIFPGTYNASGSLPSANLLPQNVWIGLRTVVINTDDGKISIQLYMDKGGTGKWTLVAQATDTGSQKNDGGAPILAAGYGGIRTDFMDVEFKEFRISAM